MGRIKVSLHPSLAIAFLVVFYLFLRLAWNSRSSCLSLSSARILSRHHYVKLK
jgi:hypothetical protein